MPALPYTGHRPLEKGRGQFAGYRLTRYRARPRRLKGNGQRGTQLHRIECGL